jgi:hypothetical protein
MTMKGPLITGVFNNQEYIGEVTQAGDKFIGQIIAVPGANQTSIFIDGIIEEFDDYESADNFVIQKWKEKFG